MYLKKKLAQPEIFLIWRNRKKIKFGDFRQIAPIAPNFLGAKICPNKVD